METFTIALSIRQRLNLMGILRQKGRGRRTDDGRQLAGDIFQKIKIPRDEIINYERTVPGIGALSNDDAIDRGAELIVELSKPEIRKLKTLIDEWDNFGPEDDLWLNSLVEQLDSPVKQEALYGNNLRRVSATDE